MMMDCSGLSFVNRKVTKIVTNTASIRRLARRSGITREVSLRLSLYKTKAHTHRELRKYQVTKALNPQKIRSIDHDFMMDEISRRDTMNFEEEVMSSEDDTDSDGDEDSDDDISDDDDDANDGDD